MREYEPTYSNAYTVKSLLSCKRPGSLKLTRTNRKGRVQMPAISHQRLAVETYIIETAIQINTHVMFLESCWYRRHRNYLIWLRYLSMFSFISFCVIAISNITVEGGPIKSSAENLLVMSAGTQKRYSVWLRREGSKSTVFHDGYGTVRWLETFRVILSLHFFGRGYRSLFA